MKLLKAPIAFNYKRSFPLLDENLHYFLKLESVMFSIIFAQFNQKVQRLTKLSIQLKIDIIIYNLTERGNAINYCQLKVKPTESRL